MPSAKVSIPAISRELEFIALHEEDARHIYNDAFKVEASLKELSIRVYDRADKDALALLIHLKAGVIRGVRGLIRVDWKRIGNGDWHVEGRIFMALGRKKGVGWVGLNIGCGEVGFRLIGWVCPRGGLDGRSQLAHTCQKKLPKLKVHLASEDRKRYPGWLGNGDAVVWLDKQMTQKMDRDDLQKEIATDARDRACWQAADRCCPGADHRCRTAGASRRFFKIANPLLKKLAEQ
jgi:hypothetical protein